ncbi:alpha-N-acetyl-neuraminyl-2,3-beta-galactosyl-1,3-N-acetyl-galactosaminide alpha-2,6-sialyltransferase-like isoform X2 [Apostichopus japonicus]|uniref:alpha-N-acetyl-neuraminyl-2,3-beta-galactosyl-1, 3-N-acetyl-galactosaminide alpha-2,6-sialyltransferase-like isoform X2 n=1 Tax=Stichopus japonicus TaxID=307972 RepID=UPI003AB51FF6
MQDHSIWSSSGEEMYNSYDERYRSRKEYRHHYKVPGVSKTLHLALTIYGTIVFFVFFFVILVSVTGPDGGHRSRSSINEQRVFSKVSVRKLIKVGNKEDTSWKKELIYHWNESDEKTHQSIIQHHTREMVKEFVGLRVNQIPRFRRMVIKNGRKQIAPLLSDGVQEDFKQHYNTCALVSNSGQLLNSKASQEINEAECIIRMNHAPTFNYTEDVGNRTTIRVCSFQAIGNIKKDLYFGKEKSDYVFMWGMDNPKRRSWARLRLRKVANMFPNQRFFTLRNRGEHLAEAIYESETQIDRDKTNSWLSTGWFTMLLALEICDDLKVYGLVSEDYCRTHNKTKVPYHYYEEQKYDECQMYDQHESQFVQGHRYLTEKSVFHRFAVLFNVSFRHPEWNIQDYNYTKLYSPFLKKWNNKTEEKGR